MKSAAGHAHEAHHLDLLVGAEFMFFRLELQRINQRLAQAISRLEAKCREREEMARRAKESKWLGEVLVQSGVQMAYGSWVWWCGEFARVA